LACPAPVYLFQHHIRRAGIDFEHHKAVWQKATQSIDLENVDVQETQHDNRQSTKYCRVVHQRTESARKSRHIASQERKNCEGRIANDKVRRIADEKDHASCGCYRKSRRS